MSENKKPRLAEILGVEVGQEFEIDGIDGVFHVDEFGFIQEPCKGRFCPGLSHAINCSGLIKRRPRWTEQEVQDAKAIIRLFGTEDFIYAMKDENGYPGLSDTDDFFTMGTIGLENNIFPSLKPGEFVKLTDIIGGNK